MSNLHAFAYSLVTPLLAAGALSACAQEKLSSPPRSFDEFEATTYHEPWAGGLYIIDGDTPVVEKKRLRERWEARFSGGRALTVHHPAGLDAKWNETQKRNLTYCIDDAFGAHKAEVIAAMAEATDGGWETFADVNFVYVPAQ